MKMLSRCRDALLFRISFIQSRPMTPITMQKPSCAHLAYLHSTPSSLEKWKNKWNFDIRDQQPSKTYIRYAVRQKRADAKKALNKLLYNYGSSKCTLEKESIRDGGSSRRHGDDHNPAEKPSKKDRVKSERRAFKTNHKRLKLKMKRERLAESDEDSGPTFQTRYGNKWYTWSFKSREESFSQSSAFGFKWRYIPNCDDSKSKKWENLSDLDSDDEMYFSGSFSDRKMLGLPSEGPLKIEDVKNAFRLSALKWHPDKHQGPSKIKAEEKFKDCVNAYKSLCNALSSV